ncbi:hypothetical protein D3C76_1116850 [compost metagenome]
MDRQITQLMMPAKAIGDRIFRVFAHAASAHHMGAAQARAIQRQIEPVDQRARFAQGFNVASIGVHGHHGPGTPSELDLGHAVEGPAQAVPDVG